MSKSKTATTVAIIQGVAAMNKSFDTMLVTYKGLEALMHQNACSALAHVAKHKDIRQVRGLMDRMEHMGAIRVNALKAWFEFFGPVTFADGTTATFDKAKATKLGAAMEAPFWQFKPEAQYIPLDVAKSLDQLVKKLDKDAKETGLDHSALRTQLLKLMEAQQAAPAPIEKKAAEKLQARKGKASEALVAAGAMQPQAPAQLPLQ